VPIISPLSGLLNVSFVGLLVRGHLLFLSMLLLLMPQAWAMDSGWITAPEHPPVQIRLSITGQVDASAKTVEALLEVRLEPGWKTYWRSPGEGGVAPRFDLSNAFNIKEVQWHWPLPGRHEFLGVQTLGYTDAVDFPLTLHLDDLNEGVTLAGSLTLATCTDICVLTQYPFWMAFTPADLAIDGEALHRYQQAMNQVPAPSSTIQVLQSHWDNIQQTLTVLLNNPDGWQSPQLLIDEQSEKLDEINFSLPEVTIDGHLLRATSQASSWMQSVDLTGETVQVTLADTTQAGGGDPVSYAVELSANLGTAPIAALNRHQPAFIQMFLLALVGGLILNVMPCVLPVLGMKLSSIVLHHGRERRAIRYQFLASSAGIVCAFWLLALFLLTLKWSGQALGWGIQFQNPWFIGFMALITGLFAVNMLGAFEVRLPSQMQTYLATRGGQGYWGHFAQGAFATLLATPCSAPFLGTAVGFALGASTIELLAIFTGLGLGMALPWLLIATLPGLALYLPKPGHWMVVIKVFFGLLLLATCLWLATLLMSFIGAVWLGAAGVPLMLILLWRLKQPSLRVSFAGVLLVFIVGGGLLLLLRGPAEPIFDDLDWQVFDESRLQQEVAAGHLVFVDITADWCITCKANKFAVLQQNPTYERLSQPDVVVMRGDWTKPSQKITAYLQSFGRFGVPFNSVYGPAAPQGITLPVILTAERVLDALDQAQ
jgi:suppressor for copper-sensitivity B